MDKIKIHGEWVAFFSLLTIASLLWAQAVISSVPGETREQYEARMKWWREARFGIFIHWGPVSMVGTEIGWSRGRQIPVEVYDNLYKRFNPRKFNPQRWAKLFKDAGAKYVVVVTKHHDGFSMFDSALTDYDCMSTPAKRDFIGEIVKACRKEGLRIMFYYSLCDWYHPHYLPRPDYVQDPPGHQRDFGRYLDFMFGQIRELCEKYRPDGIWFDGGWEHSPQEWQAERLMKLIHGILPNAVVNNRSGLPGDYDTPEQQVGAFNLTRAWESCITLGTQWSWKPNDRIKSLRECLRLLVSCAGGDGNLLLNVAPTPDGEIEERQAMRLREIGAWLKKFGESIYGTRGGPFMPGRWGASTHKGKTIYLHILNWDGDRLVFPAIEGKIVGAKLLTGGELKVAQDEKAITIIVPPKHQHELVTLVRLDLDRPAKDISPRQGPQLPVPKARASNVYLNDPNFGPEKAIDGDETTRWATDFGTHSAWLEVDLGKPMKIGEVRIIEAVEFGERVKKFALRCRRNGEWETVITGTKIGENFAQKFPPIIARYWRLDILEASEGPTIYELQLLPPK